MRFASFAALTTTLGFPLLVGLFAAPIETPTRAAPAQRTAVIVELFTSEGCSSCPPADALLKKLETQQPIPGATVIPLEEHVDYWNHDGWVDPFSSALWTNRQEAYVAAAKRSSVYTPEMVVDGRDQFVGSSASEALIAVTNAVRAPNVAVKVSAGKMDDEGAQSFHVSVGKLGRSMAGKSADVWLAVTEDGLHSSITGGENAGRVLYHAAILRSLRNIGVAKSLRDSPAFTADIRVQFDPTWNRANLRIVVFVQQGQTGPILGAAWTRVTQDS